MKMNPDFAVFALYLVCVITVGLLASRRKGKNTDDYFLASRSLTWWVIGGSLIAANISTHHFIGMAGQGFTVGLAVASYEWIAAIALILYGKFFLPYYLKSRIQTMPKFLETRFNAHVRMVFVVISLIGYVFIELAVVLYTGSLAIQSIFPRAARSSRLSIRGATSGSITFAPRADHQGGHCNRAHSRPPSVNERIELRHLLISEQLLPQYPCGHRALILDNRGLQRVGQFAAQPFGD